MLARKKLIDLRAEFPRIRKEGKIYDTPLFGMVISYSATSKTPQWAFIVSKKVSLKSVVRHEIKRKLSDSISIFLPNLNKSVQLTFLAKQKLIESTKDEIKKEMESVLRRSRLIVAAPL